MNSYVDVLKKIQITKKPKVICFYKDIETNLLIIDQIPFKVSR